ncbi:MAG: hypothetical protein ABJO01_15035 [Parasphingorhabdus sp.]|uniref:hypothetical protein n=1 Tax=Parasphingorhabdus sp. TaxID=2709688 RepID=UPI003296E175
MMVSLALWAVAAAMPMPPAAVQGQGEKAVLPASYFEGRWAFVEDTCNLASNWTLLAGGNFISDDLIGSWQWNGTQLRLNLTDLAVDEETGEKGGRFQMEGPVIDHQPDQFTLVIEPDHYKMKRCE